MTEIGPVIQAAKSILLVVSALFPIVDPIGGAPVFLALTRDYTPETRRLLARRIALNSYSEDACLSCRSTNSTSQPHLIWRAQR